MIDWIGSVFIRPPDKEMRGLEWGTLYETYHSNSYNPALIDTDVDELRGDPAVHKRKGIYEYLLGGKTRDPSCSPSGCSTTRPSELAYEQQTAEGEGRLAVSNCPLCAVGNNANKTRIYKRDEMDADHVTAWSKGGATNLTNCEMLCVTHNRSKGNR